VQLEAIAQTAGIIMLQRAENAGQIAYFMAAENVKWRKPVFPGDVLVIEVEMTKMRGKLGKAKGICKVGGENRQRGGRDIYASRRRMICDLRYTIYAIDLKF